MGEIIMWPRDKMKPRKAPARRSRRPGEIRIKYFTEGEIKLLRRTVRDQAILHLKKGCVTGVREWLAIDILTSSGLRASEVSNLRVGDCLIGYGKRSLYVREGKWGKDRTVRIPEGLKDHLRRFIAWKEQRGEATGPDCHLFLGKQGPWTRQAVQGVVKKYLTKLALYQKGKSVHALRHSYAVDLYRKEKDLRAVQIQLGHSSTQTTMIYADVLEEDIDRQIRNLWQGR